MNLSPPPQVGDPIITQFKPVRSQWGLNDKNIKHIDAKTRNTFLHNYCKHINATPLEVYQYLIETLGCDVNAQNIDNDTPVHRALRYFDLNNGGDITVLIYLLSQKGVNVNIQGKYGYNLLHMACYKINRLPLGIFQYLVETVGCDVNVQDKNNDTPLHNAIRDFDQNDGGDIAVLMYLLTQKGVNVNIKGRNGYSLLHVACININKLPIDIFKVLMDTKGCDVNAQDDDKDTPLHNALVCFNQNDGGDTNVLMYLLSQKDINVNIKGKLGHSLLHIACININKLPLDIFKVLIETMGCDVNVQNDNKDTPLHYAFRCFEPSSHGDINALYYLLNQKIVDINIKGQYGYTILHWACGKINKLPLEIFKVLIETLGCDVNAQDNDKNTPIHRAFEYFNPRNGGDINVLTYPINQNTVNVNTQYKNGYTLLHTTCIINLSNTRYSAKLNAEYDTIMCQIVEFIAERCIEEVFDEKTPLEATKTI
jgi:ankyrin repeat protein